jgi:hypothetical protein
VVVGVELGVLVGFGIGVILGDEVSVTFILPLLNRKTPHKIIRRPDNSIRNNLRMKTNPNNYL